MDHYSYENINGLPSPTRTVEPIHEELNIENIDILENELQRSNAALNRLNMDLIDSSIQRMESSGLNFTSHEGNS